MFTPKLLVFSFWSLFAVISVQAVLTLNIDTLSEEVWFTGSDSGTMTSDFGIGEATWFLAGGDNSASNESFSSVETIIERSPAFTGFLTFTADEDGTLLLSFFTTTNAGAFIEFTGTEVTTSYSGFSPDVKTALAGLTGTFGVSKGTDFSPISISYAAVPEPSMYVGLLGFVTFGWITIRRGLGSL